MTRSGHFYPVFKEAMGEMLSVVEGIASTGCVWDGVTPCIEPVYADDADGFGASNRRVSCQVKHRFCGGHLATER